MDNIKQSSCDKTLSNNKLISAESCSDDDEGKEIAMETVEALLQAAVTEQADDNYSESDSRSTPTKADKSSSDSGVCINMEEQSTTNADVNPDIEDMNSVDVSSSDNPNMSPNHSGNNIVLSSTFNDESLTKVNNDPSEGQTVSNDIEVENHCGNGKVNELPVWPRRTRRGARNYRHSTQEDGQDVEEGAEDEEVVVNATEEEQMPLLSETTSQSTNAEAVNNIDTSMPSEAENSPAISDGVNIRHVSTSPVFSDDYDDIHDDDDDDDDDDSDDYISEGSSDEDENANVYMGFEQAVEREHNQQDNNSTANRWRRSLGLS
uniref:Uncharacterized protein n=1 Tax=Zeugodacus cucurbitae TaxID=28588 RepID=A0A0A1X3T1_ZEUCU